MNPHPPVVLVEWEDAYAPDVGETWVAQQPPQWKPLIVYTAGFLLYDGAEGLLITDSVMPGHTGQRCQIPRGMVRKVTVLTPKPKLTRKTHADSPS